MRKPDTIEVLYADADGFFAGVHQQCFPALRGRPVGVIPFETDQPESTCIIACSKEAKAAGCKNVMDVREARQICRDLVLVSQRPDLYRRAHAAILNEVACEIPIEVVKSIDEFTCRLDRASVADPYALSHKIKSRLRENIGPYITLSLGFATNRLLAKIACARHKPDGVTLWSPQKMPAPLLAVKFEDVPGIGGRLEKRLRNAGIVCMTDLLATQPKQLRQLWGSVTGERIWYALQGYAIHALPTGRGMYGHGRTLQPAWRSLDHAQAASRVLLTKAARRMRRDRFYANRLQLWLSLRDAGRTGERSLPCVNDDQACLSALGALWHGARNALPPDAKVIRVGTVLMDLVPVGARQLDMFLADDLERQRWETITDVMDGLNSRFGDRVVTLGDWKPPGQFSGGKVAFGRVPSAEDFW